MTRCSRILAALGLLALVISTPVIASTVTGATYRGQVNVINTSYASANNAVPFTLSTQNMIDSSYIESDCSNVAITDLAGADVPFMPAPGAGTDWIIFEDDILQNATNSYYLYTGGGAMNGSIRWFPAAGGMTVADSPTLELGNNFEIEVKGYFDVSAGAAKNIVNKPDAIVSNVSGAGTITTTVYPTGATDQSYATGSTVTSMYNVNWNAQGFTPAASGYLTAVTLNLKKQNSPAGNVDVVIRATAAGVPTGGNLATTGSIVADTTLTTSFADYTFTLTTPLSVTAGTVYAIVCSAPAADLVNYVAWAYNTSNGYGGGQYSTSANSGSSWTGDANKDRRFTTVVSIPATSVAAGCTSGEHTLKIVANGSTLKTLWDGAEKDSDVFAGTIVNNGQTWTFLENNSALYMEYLKVTTSGTLKGHWYWENAATFADQSGNSNTATPTFRTTTTDADVSASLVNFAPLSPSSGGVTSTTASTGPITSVPVDPVVTDVTPHNMTNIPFIGTPISDYLVEHDYPEGVFTYPFMMIMLAVVIFIVFHFTKDIGWAGIAQFVLSGLFIAWRLLPWPALFFFGVVLAFTIIKRRTISL